jgi:formiminoglutamate deiminase
MVARYFLDHALLPEGWAERVLVTVENGRFSAVEPNAAPDGAERLAGIAIPGMPNLHSHAFQRAMAALAEVKGPGEDSFWTWRQVMYRFLDTLNPEDIEAIAAFAYMEMLEGGFTAVGEFHYLHHDPDGRPYANLAETSERIAAAATATGIGLTLLPSFYAYGGVGGLPPVHGQRRFITTPEQFLKLQDGARKAIAGIPGAVMGTAPHSLRAVTPETLREVVAAGPGPFHIHAAEQVKEVEDTVAWSGKRPVEWLLDEMGAGEGWCLIHTTHLTEDETRRLAASGAIAGLCPLTEGSLGDGIFDGERYLLAGGAFGIGTDSNIQITAPGELAQLEYTQRLASRRRNVLAPSEGDSIGRHLWTSAAGGGAKALAQPMGAIAPGLRADLVVLDADHPDLAAAKGDRWLDQLIFALGRSAISVVMAGGVKVVVEGRHLARERISATYGKSLKRILTH